jgi:O-antigen ligase
VGSPSGWHAPEAATMIERGLLLGLLAVVLLAPWLWGGNTTLARSGLGSATSLLVAAMALSVGLRLIKPPVFSGVALLSIALWLIWLAWIGFQLVPLPADLLQKLSPLSFEHHESLRSVHPAPSYTLSIAPGYTIDAALDSITLFSIYCLALALSTTPRRIRLVLTVVLWSGLVQAVYGIQSALTAEGSANGASGSFVNRNHFAAYLEIVAAIGIGLVLADLSAGFRLGWRALYQGTLDLLLSEKLRNRVAVALIVVAVVVSRSRMGNIALFTALAVAGLLFVALRMRTHLVPAVLLFASLVMVDLLIISQWYGLEQLVERIEKTDLRTEQRPLVWNDLEPVVKGYAPYGAGLGTFAAAYAPFRGADIRGYYDHAHNEYAEFLVEVGPVGLVILGALVAIHLIHAGRIILYRRRAIFAGAGFAVLMSSVAVLIHAGAEFHLRIPAVAITWVMLLGLCVAMAHQSVHRRSRSAVNTVTE